MSTNNSQSPGSGLKIIICTLSDALELNLSWMPFIKDGGLFVASTDMHVLREMVWVDLTLPNTTNPIRIEGKVVWITPQNALHHVLPGIGVRFTGPNAAEIRRQIEGNLVNSVEVGGYTYGMTDDGFEQGKSS